MSRGLQVGGLRRAVYGRRNHHASGRVVLGIGQLESPRLREAGFVPSWTSNSAPSRAAGAVPAPGRLLTTAIKRRKRKTEANRRSADYSPPRRVVSAKPAR